MICDGQAKKSWRIDSSSSTNRQAKNGLLVPGGGRKRNVVCSLLVPNLEVYIMLEVTSRLYGYKKKNPESATNRQAKNGLLVPGGGRKTVTFSILVLWVDRTRIRK